MKYRYKQYNILIFIVVISIGLILFGENCSQRPFSKFEGNELSSQDIDANALWNRSVANLSTSLIVLTRSIDTDSPGSLQSLIQKIQVAGGRLVQVLPTGDLEIEFNSTQSAKAFALANKSIVEPQKMLDLSSARMKRRSISRAKAPTLNASTVTLLKKSELYNRMTPTEPPIKVIPKAYQKKLLQLRKNLTALASTNSTVSNSSLHDNSNSLQFPPIGNQGGQGSCVAWSMGYYLTSYANAVTEAVNNPTSTNSDLQNNPDSQFLCSPSFLYPHINGGYDGGSNPGFAGTALVRHGCASLKTLPLSKMTDKNNIYSDRFFPSVNAQVAAMKYRPQAYEVVAPEILTDQSLLTIKEKIDQGVLISTAIAVYDSFFKFSDPTTTSIPVSCGTYTYPDGVITNTESCNLDSAGQPRIEGYHEITIVGYDDVKQAFKIANSWGTTWGDQGFAWVSYNLFRNDRFSVMAFYALTDFEIEPPRRAYIVVSENYAKPDYLTEDLNDQQEVVGYHVGVQYQYGFVRDGRDSIIGNRGASLTISKTNYLGGDYLQKRLLVMDVSDFFDLTSDTTFLLKADPTNRSITDVQLFLYDGVKASGVLTKNYSSAEQRFTLSYTANRPSSLSPPVILEEPQDITKNLATGFAIFEVVASGTDIYFQWFKDGKRVSERSRRAFLYVYNLSKSLDNSKYTVEVSNSQGAIMSAEATLRVVDIEPRPFKFTWALSEPIAKPTITNQVTLMGIDNDTPISIDFGSYSVNGAPFTTESGFVNRGDKVRVQLISSSEYDDVNYATLYVGSYFVDFLVRTIPDTFPDKFLFNPISRAQINTFYTSNEIIVSGLGPDGAYTTISGGNGTYQINSYGYANSLNHVINGDKITVRVQTTAARSNVMTTLKIGAVQGDFKVKF